MTKRAPNCSSLFKQMAEPVRGGPCTRDTSLFSAGSAALADAVGRLARADRQLARVIERVGPCTLKPEGQLSPFAALVEAVVYQQLHGKAASAILGRVKALFPHRRFPKPEDFLATPEAALRAAGLSQAKLRAILDISSKTQAGLVPSSRSIARLSDEEIVERLTMLRGVGRWTVEMLLIFKIGRPDVLPATDYGVRQGFAITRGLKDLPKPADVLEYGERWRPYRTVASWYLWRAVELSRSPKPRIQDARLVLA